MRYLKPVRSAKIQNVAKSVGFSIEKHEARIDSAVPALGCFVKSADRSGADVFGYTDAEYDRLELIADEAMLVLAEVNGNVTDWETEWALQDLEGDFIAITGKNVVRPRHPDASGPTFTNTPTLKF